MNEEQKDIQKEFFVSYSEMNGQKIFAHNSLVSEDYLSFDDTSLETVISENIASLVEGLEVVGGWRLPNREEIDYVYTHKTEINDNFHLIKDVPLDNFAATETFFYRENDNTIKVFPLTNGEPYEPTSGKATNLRAFTTKTF